MGWQVALVWDEQWGNPYLRQPGKLLCEYDELGVAGQIISKLVKQNKLKFRSSKFVFVRPKFI